MATSVVRLFSDRERAICRFLAQLAYGNQFLTERIELEKAILGEAFVYPGRFMSAGADPRETHENVGLLTALVRRIMPAIRDRYAAGAEASDDERAFYIGACFFLLYDRYEAELLALIDAGARKALFFKAFRDDHRHYLGFLGPAPDVPDAAHAFAVLFQIRRAFHFIYTQVRGGSLPVARLRAALWNAIFGGALDAYALDGWTRMAQLSTLIQGPSGTGKELAAKAIALSGYVPFNKKTMTFAPHGDYYQAINLSALSPALMESELFGHRKGAFTGADRDKKGLLARVPSFGGVLLDEIAEIKLRMQVKLLRVLQERSFRPVGDEDQEIRLQARLLTATHRDPAERILAGKLREDFFRRICMLLIVTPSLRERLDDHPDELIELVGFLAAELVGPRRAPRLTEEVVAWIGKHLARHPWTGNMRELLQCVADVWVSKAYVPLRLVRVASGGSGGLDAALAEAGLPVDELVRRYAAGALARAGSLPEAARALGVDTRRLKRILAGGVGEVDQG